MDDIAQQNDIAQQKSDLRRTAKAARQQAFARHGAAAGERLAAHGIAFADPPAGASLSAFLAIGDEIDPLPLLRRLWQAGHVTALPVMVGKARPLIFRQWRQGEALIEVQWGIREPLETAPVIVPDVVLVPLLAFDARGYRLGYGGGFYDRSIAEIRACKPVVTIGLAYDELQVDAVPHCQYDEPLDWVLTPSGPLRTRSG
jgi:5-formyltetrahydrofolate cyclo-ligase